MLVHWRGWGWTVFFVPLALLPVVFAVLFTARRATVLAMNADKFIHQALGVWLLVSALCVYAIDRWCEGRARERQGGKGGLWAKAPVREDSFLYMAMFAWPYVLGVMGLSTRVYSLWL
jgi:hypothetical protein